MRTLAASFGLRRPALLATCCCESWFPFAATTAFRGFSYIEAPPLVDAENGPSEAPKPPPKQPHSGKAQDFGVNPPEDEAPQKPNPVSLTVLSWRNGMEWVDISCAPLSPEDMAKATSELVPTIRSA